MWGFSDFWAPCPLPAHRPRTGTHAGRRVAWVSAPPRPQAPNSPRCFYTSWSREPQFISIGYVDDTEFLRFDSNAASPRMKPQTPWVEGPWVEQALSGYWEPQRQVSKGHAQNEPSEPADRAPLLQPERGQVSHLPGDVRLRPGARQALLRGSEQYAYDGADYTALNEDLHSWTAADRHRG